MAKLARNVQHVQQILDQHRSGAEIWISAAGYSTWRHDEYEQLRALISAAAAPVDRIYWYAARDLDPEFSTRDGFHATIAIITSVSAAATAHLNYWRACGHGGLTAVAEALEPQAVAERARIKLLQRRRR